MAEKEKESKVVEIPWSVENPLEDDDDEKECQRRARGELRKAYLIEQLSKKPKGKDDKEGKRRLFS